MIKITERMAKLLLKHLDDAEESLSKKTEAFNDIKRAKNLVAPIITKHIHQNIINKSLKNIINQKFDGKSNEFMLWYLNEFHDHDLHDELNYASSAINELTFMAQDVLTKCQSPEVQEDEFAQKKLVTKYNILMALIHKTRNYNKDTFVLYNVHIDKPYVKLMTVHDVMKIVQSLNVNGSLYDDLKHLHA